MTLEVRASNKTAQVLYEKYGFKEVGLRHGYYLDNREDAVIMTTESIAAETFRDRVRRLRAALEVRLDDERAG
jgi:ribosomal-protein-alanine N-acetyltransferase